MKKMKLTYSAYTSTQDGQTFEHTGTIEGARRKARKYAYDAFPAWGHKGYGPTIVIRDAETKEELLRETM